MNRVSEDWSIDWTGPSRSFSHPINPVVPLRKSSVIPSVSSVLSVVHHVVPFRVFRSFALSRSQSLGRNQGDEMTRDEALALLHAYTQSESLRKHAYAVEAAMRAYARKLGGDEEL